MASILILFAHPAFEKSRVQRALLQSARQVPGVSVHDLYEAYPDFDIDTDREQQKLLQHDIILLQHPLYWYSAPALVKQWIDLVLEHGWAYGKTGTKLQGKYLGNVVSAGGPEAAYHKDGRNRFSLPELFRPFEQTALLCHMQYLPPFVVHDTFRLDASGIAQAALSYQQTLQWLQHASADDWRKLSSATYLQHLVSSKTQ